MTQDPSVSLWVPNHPIETYFYNENLIEQYHSHSDALTLKFYFSASQIIIYTKIKIAFYFFNKVDIVHVVFSLKCCAILLLNYCCCLISFVLIPEFDLKFGLFLVTDFVTLTFFNKLLIMHIIELYFNCFLY